MVEQCQFIKNEFNFENHSIFGLIRTKISQKRGIFLAISRGRISREKCLAKPFLVLARNARNVHLYYLDTEKT